tara:strand:- start:3191 stop:3418 length:228 start_codon:yes stop_codon:yes gene_type:complete
MAQVEIFKNSFNLNHNYDFVNENNQKFINNIYKSVKNNFTTLSVENSSMIYFKNILNNQKQNNKKKDKLQKFFLI